MSPSPNRRGQNSSAAASSATTSSSLGGTIDTSLTGRIGFPAPLPPMDASIFPHASERIDSLDYKEIQREIISLLRAYLISFHEIFVVIRQTSGTVKDLRPAIIIVADMTSRDACFAVMEKLQSQVLLCHANVSAEIMDPETFVLPMHFHVENTHPICPIWTQLLHDIEKTLPSESWTSISGVRRGSSCSPMENPVTIVITTNRPQLMSSVEFIADQCCRSYLLFDIEVAVLNLSSIFAWGDEGGEETGVLPVLDEILPGASVGMSSEPIRAGTLGGTLTIDIDGRKHKVAMTNDHVVRCDEVQGSSLFKISSCSIHTPDGLPKQDSPPMTPLQRVLR